MDNVIDFPSPDGVLDEDVVWRVERLDGMAVHALGLASAYAAHNGGFTPEQVVERATAYLAFLRGQSNGTVQ